MFAVIILLSILGLNSDSIYFAADLHIEAEYFSYSQSEAPLVRRD